MVGRFSPRTEVRQGDVLEIACDTRALHFFDPESGMAIYTEQDSMKGAGK
jgi:multiple sugar transport system ATP-binding protein